MSRYATYAEIKEVQGPGIVELANHLDERLLRLTVDEDPSEQVSMVELDERGVRYLRDALSEWLGD